MQSVHGDSQAAQIVAQHPAAAQSAVLHHTDGPGNFCWCILCGWWNPKFAAAKNVAPFCDHEDDMCLIHVNDKLTRSQGS